MTSPADYYPELDGAEIAESITPLARFDGPILTMLGDGSGDLRSVRADGATAPEGTGDWIDEAEEYPFQRVVRSLAAHVAATGPLAGHEDLLHDPRALLREVLTRTEVRLREVCTRPLVAAVNRARERGVLTGSTPQERYRSFVRQAVDSSFEEAGGLAFPVLRGLVPLLVRNERVAVGEVLRRLAADRADLARVLGLDPADRLVSLGAAEGDTHHHGRSVGVLTFRSGRRVVHKPRDVSCEAAYERLVPALNARYGTRLAAARVLRCDGYGYVEYVEAEDVADVSARFLRESGELAAVLYLLNARDMHFENILPTRRGPVPIDLETLLHPERLHHGPVPEAPGNAYAAIGGSVYGIGILPLVMPGKGPDAGHIDLGFLGGQGRGATPFKSLRFENPYTDRISLVLRSSAAAERRTVAGAVTEARVRELGRCMAEGFTRLYRAVLADREGWTGLLRRTATGARVRYVHNPTALYGQTLRMTSGPAALDGTGTYLALLKRVAIASKSGDRPLVRSEIRQLAERDVPYFTVAADGTDLCDGSGAPVGSSFDSSPLQQALDKAGRLSEPDLREQLRLIHSAFSSRFPDNHLGAAGTTPAGGPAPDAALRREEMTALVRRLCDRLVETSLPDQFAHLPRTWIGPIASADANRPWPPGVLGYDLYTGRTGPALALASAARLLGDGAYRELPVQIFSTTAEILATRGYETRSVQQAGFAGYTGMAGVLFALASAGRLLDEKDWVAAAQGALPLVMDQIRAAPADRLPMDVIGGLAGVIPCVAAVGGPHAPEALAALAGLLTRLLRDPARTADPLFAQSGFAHGVSGALHALCRTHPVLSGAEAASVRETAAGLLERLRHFHDPAEDNWFSSTAGDRTYSTGWCHGATGIALSLAACAETFGEHFGERPGHEGCGRLRDRAARNLVAHGFGRNLTWCHGDLGNHDVLRALAEAEAEPGAEAQAGTAGTGARRAGTGTGGAGVPALRDSLAEVEDRWLHPDAFARKIDDSTSRYAHTSSLMVGTAGIVVHLVGRLDPAVRLSPVTLTLEDRR
ncbi:type 2 lanthipeptide synthetase LanM family protein [Streptomyces castrisilvae]|uniref:Type 2 lanthipeptide synthetase LanM family protein n=1 Tax=Streptomyces castrisilvae TaxID=3033811 RepID=A0ABY9HI59_9ACTN|nr:type 2 lanthipeptide synthetase LanM family protein [Streptomyces sp. Mut1]WLQ34215.1 type 2 lanthipeptide synthetase LanM family protein [Streptomyces sp. Mut1]